MYIKLICQEKNLLVKKGTNLNAVCCRELDMDRKLGGALPEAFEHVLIKSCIFFRIYSCVVV